MRTHRFLLGLSISTPLLLLACGGNGTTGGGGGSGGSAADSGSTSTSGNGNSSTSTSGNSSTSTSGNGSSSSSGNGSSSSSGGPGACPVFPSDNPWNMDISAAKVDPLSANYINSIGPAIAFHPDFGSGPGAGGIPYVYVDNSVMKSPV